MDTPSAGTYIYIYTYYVESETIQNQIISLYIYTIYMYIYMIIYNICNMYIHYTKYILLYKTIILYSYEHRCEMDIMILWGRESSDQMPNNCTEPCRHLVGGVHSKIDWYLPAFTPRAADTFQATPCNTEVAVKRRIGLQLTGSPVVKWNDWPTKWPANDSGSLHFTARSRLNWLWWWEALLWTLFQKTYKNQNPQNS